MTNVEKDQMAKSIMQQLIKNQAIKNIPTGPPEFLELLELLHKNKIVSLKNGTATPLKPALLKLWNNHNTIEKYTTFINLMDKHKPKKTLGFSIEWTKLRTIGLLLGGIVSVITLLAGFFKEPEPVDPTPIPQLTVFVTDLNGNVVLEHTGEVNTSLGNRSLRITIGEDGRVNFDDLQKSYIGDTIQLGFKADGWRLANPDTTYVFTGKPIILKIRRDLGTIKGTVKNRETADYIAGATVRINTDTIVYTDSLGVFNIELPLKYQVPDIHHRYKLEASAKGYETDALFFQPLSSPADFRLVKKK